MERDIKFRGKRIEDGQWIYGYLANAESINNINEVAAPNEDVDPDTIGQFIGMFDNWGNEIYEGDIFTVNGRYPKVVAYRKDRAAFCIANIDELGNKWLSPWQCPASDWWKDYNRDIAVIGNIYDSQYSYLKPLI